jgi:uncharacterized protein with PhoU and TrkA domain
MSCMDGAVYRLQDQVDRLKKELLFCEAQRVQLNHDLDRFRQVLANEQALRKVAEAARDVAQEKVRELERDGQEVRRIMNEELAHWRRRCTELEEQLATSNAAIAMLSN